MKIVIRLYRSNSLGDSSPTQIEIPTNKITVSKLKTILYNKFKIPQSEQRLTVKLLNHSLVTMTEDYPLYFFFITPNSVIFLEHVKPYNKTEEICKRLIGKSPTKYKYIRSLGLLSNKKYSNQESSKSLHSIIESPNEYNDEYFNKNSNHTFSEDDETVELLLNSVKKNNLTTFKELIEQNVFSKLDINSIVNESNLWNPLHYASYYGYTELGSEIIRENKADVNALTREGYTPLYLAVYKLHIEMTRLLLEVDDIDINHVYQNVGTVLHIACKRNCLKIISMLLVKNADYKIKDNNGKFPYELSTEITIRKLFNKVLNIPTQSINDYSLSTKSQNSSEHFSFLNLVDFIPPKQNRVIGKIEKIGNLFPLFRKRILVIDPFMGSLKRYKSSEDYPINPK